MIAILCPTRRRPEQLKRMVDSVHRTSDAKVYISATEGDSLSDMCAGLIVSPDGLPTVHRWNELAKLAMEDEDNKLFMLGSDDTVFTTPLWDQALLDHYNALENKIHVYHLQDSRDKDGTPHPIVTREYIEAMGYFMSPIFNHWFIDSWSVAIGRAVNCFTHIRDYLLEHVKPSDIGKPDETHINIRRAGIHERDKEVNKTCQHFLETEKYRLRHIIMDRHHKKFRASL